MLASTFQFFAIAVLSSELIDEFDLSRGRIGLLGAVNTGAGAVLAAKVGVWTDRLGGRRSATAVLVISGVGLLWTSVSNSYWMLFGASFLAGAPQAGGNPATNRLIGQHVTPGRRGTITGWKQSGVQFGAFLSGFTMPTAAAWFGWRQAFGIYGAAVMLLAAVAWLGLPPDLPDEPAPAAAHGESRERLPDIIRRLAVYGFLLGVFGGGVGRFLPLFAEEELGYTATVAGLVVALAGALGIVSRLWWGRAIERGLDARRSLSVIALGAAAAGLLLVAAATTVAALVWVCAVLLAFTVTAWNVVGMLTIIRDSPSRDTGRASGLVMLGFLGGLTVGGPLVGAIVDATDNYVMAWLVLIVFAVVAVPAPGRRRRSTEGVA